MIVANGFFSGGIKRSTLKSDGVNDYVDCANGATTNMTDFIISLHVKSAGTTGAGLWGRLIHKASQFCIGEYGNSAGFCINNNDQFIVDAAHWDTTSWFHLVVWRISTTVFYESKKNGIIVKSGSYSATGQWSSSNNNTPRLFIRSDNTTGTFEGYLHDVIFCPYSAPNLATIQAGNIPAASIIHIITNEKSGNTVINKGTGNNGTCVNMNTALGFSNSWVKRSNLTPYLN